ncbi:response regulator [Spirochaeta dissipatitropha]
MADLKVVIIDDEAWTRDTIKRIGRWREFGFRIAGEANDGIFGLECIRQLKPDLVITDMKMPGLDGAQMLKELQKQEHKPKVIIISGYSDYSYTRQALAVHAVDYLLKPIDSNELNSLLQQCAIDLHAQSDRSSSHTIFEGLHNVDSDWLRKYQSIRDSSCRSISALSSSGFKEACTRLKDLYYESDIASRPGVLIKISYDLHSFLEEQLISWPADDINISIAIGENITIEELMDHYSAIVKKLIAGRVAQSQQTHRIDLRPILHYLENNFQDSISLVELSEEFAVSKEYLCSLFKKETGCTITEYLTRIRMNKARDLITHYQLPLKKIPEMVGYIDVSHFYKTFKRYFGVTPGQFRNNQHADTVDAELNNGQSS